MTAPTPTFPAPAQGLQLHRRLCAGDPLAPSELADGYYVPLAAWLAVTQRAAEHDCYEAAGRAVVSLIKNPATYNPQLKDLTAYLKMAAQRDLLNVQRKERRHHRDRRDWQAVEDSPDAGKYLGRGDDPALPLCVAEEGAKRSADSPPGFDSWTETERRVFELMRQGERRNAAFAVLLGIEHLPRAERDREVKRVKDRLKKRQERGGR